MPIPRRKIDEVITRADLSKMITLIVEGPTDERVLNLVKSQEHSPTQIKALDVQCVDTIELNRETLEAHGMKTTGARQRVIAFSREMERENNTQRVQSLIDRDIDDIIGQNIEHSRLHYTDYGCLDGYLWNLSTAKSCLYHFRCEENFMDEPIDVEALFSSVNEVCKKIAVVRAIAVSQSTYELSVNNFEKCLSLDRFCLRLDDKKYLRNCVSKPKQLEKVVELFAAYEKANGGLSPMLVLNSHDLISLLAYAIKRLTKGSRFLVSDDAVFNCLFSHGVQKPEIIGHKLFRTLVKISKERAS